MAWSWMYYWSNTGMQKLIYLIHEDLFIIFKLDLPALPETFIYK